MNVVGKNCWAACLGLLVSLVAHAEDGAAWQGDRFTLSGFGTLGLARSDTGKAEYVRDLSQPYGVTGKWSGKIDSLFGVQANLKLSPQTEGIVQLISRYRYDGSYRPEVSWAFLRHDFSPDFQARVGRLGTEFYMQADSRLVGYSNTTVRPPPDFYGPLIFSYFDGFDVSASTALESGLLRGKFFAGRAPESTPFYGDVVWNLEGARLIGGHLDYYQGPWQFRIGHTIVKFPDKSLPLDQLVPFPAVTLFPELDSANTLTRFDSLGLIYDEGPLRVQSMLGRIRYETESYEDSRAAFVIGSYRVGAFTPYLGYSVTKSSRSKITTTSLIPGLQAAAADLTRATHSDHHTVTLGTRWDFEQNWALKLQLDRVRGSRDSAFTFRGPDRAWDGSMNVLSVSLDFAF